MARNAKDDERINEVRRRLLQASAVAGGSLVLGHLPYQKPALKSFFGVREAYAQATTFLEINAAGRLGDPQVAPGTPGPTGQDCYRFNVPTPNTTLTITVTPDAFLDIEVFLYGPGLLPPFAGQTNLLTSNTFGLNQAGVGGVETAMITVAAVGDYHIAVEDERGPADEVAGDYSIQIVADNPIGPFAVVCDEGDESDLT